MQLLIRVRLRFATALPPKCQQSHRVLTFPAATGTVTVEKDKDNGNTKLKIQVNHLDKGLERRIACRHGIKGIRFVCHCGTKRGRS